MIRHKAISLDETRFAQPIFGEMASIDVDRFVDELTPRLEKESGWTGSHDVVLSLFDEKDLLPGEYVLGNVRMKVDGAGVSFLFRDEDGSLQTVQATRQELEGYIRALRRRVHERLKARGEERIHVKSHGITSRVHDLHGAFVYKEPISSPDAAKQSQEALRKLYALPVRSPFIRYPETRVAQDGSGVQRKLGIQTLEKLLVNNQGCTVGEALTVFHDFVSAGVFLVEHGLRCTDLDLTNIGVDVQSGRGFAFDFDGLRLEGRAGVYVSKYAYFPPERLQGDYAPIQQGFNKYGVPIQRPVQEMPTNAITTAEMVFELGVSLFSVLQCFPELDQDPRLEPARELALKMMEANPKIRPTIQDVAKLLGRWVDSPEIQSILDRSEPPRPSYPLSQESDRFAHNKDRRDVEQAQTAVATEKTVSVTPETVVSANALGNASTLHVPPKPALRGPDAATLM